jgi:glutaredoxin
MPDPLNKVGTLEDVPFILIIRKPKMESYTIYTQAGRKCPYCEKAAELLESRNIPFSLRPLGRKELLELAAKANMTTVPIIYAGDNLVGGCDALEVRLLA